MQRSVRRLTRVVILGAIAAFAAVPLLATSASAQSSEDAVCTFNVLPNPIAPPFPAAVHIEGTAPAGTDVTAFSGATALVTATANAAGNFSSGNFNVFPDTDVSATFTVGGSSYATGCADPKASWSYRCGPRPRTCSERKRRRWRSPVRPTPRRTC